MAIGSKLTSCSEIGNPDPEDVITKINSGKTLDKADYVTIVDYIDDFSYGTDSSDDLYESGREAVERYPYFKFLRMALANAVDTS